MPTLIDHIDAIARQRQCDVLYLEFHPQDHERYRLYHHEADPQRDTILAWLAANGIDWLPCGPNASSRLAMSSWRGQICFDIAYDEALAAYCQLRDYLELPDGSMRHAGVRFCVQPLGHAMKNAAHDEPGYWDRRAEDF